MEGATRRVRWLASTALLLALAACGPSNSSPNLADPALATFDGGGLTFNYPAAWRQFRHDAASSFSSLIVDLGTVDIPNTAIIQAQLQELIQSLRFHAG